MPGLKFGVDSRVAEGRESLLYCAIDRKKRSLVELLLSGGASPDLPQSSPALVLAASKRRRDIVKKLLRVGTDVGAKDEEGTTTFNDASAHQVEHFRQPDG